MNGMSDSVTYTVIFVLLLLAEELWLGIARKFRICDQPNTRSSHTTPVLRGGGVIFPVAILLFQAFFGLHYPWFLAGLLLVAAVSLWEDIKSVPDTVRLVTHFAAIALMLVQLWNTAPSSPWLVLPALFIGAGVINAFNFMDGINGITGAYSIAVIAPLIYLNDTIRFIDPAYLLVANSGILVFCMFNFRKRPACFAGDVGAVSIALILFFAIAMLIAATGDFSWLTLLAVYGADTALTICHRIKLHQNIRTAHREHIYQLMANELKISHLAVAGIYAAIQLLISVGLIFLPVNHYVYMAAVGAILTAVYIIFIKKYYPLHAANSTPGE